MRRAAPIGILALLLAASPSGAAPRKTTFANGSRIYSIRVDGSGRKMLSALFGWDNEAGVWSPNGRRIAYLVGSFGERRAHRFLYVMRPDGSGKRRLSLRSMLAGRQGDPPSWSPDGSQVAFSGVASSRGTGIWTVRAGGRGLLLTARGGFEPAWSPQGLWIAYRARSGLRVAAPRGGRSRQIVRGGSTPNWSPDGKRMAYISSGGRALLVVRIAGGTAKRVLRASGELGQPSWSPDGRKLLVGDWAPRIFLVEPGRNRVVLLGPGAGPRWSPDGRLIAFASTVGAMSTDVGLYVMNADGSNRRAVWSAPGWAVGSVDWSPRGDLLLFDAAPVG